MAADTRVTTDGAYYHADKIFRIGDSLFGTAGDGCMCLVMIDWLKTSRNRQSLYKQWGDYERDQVYLMQLSPKGLYLWTGWGVPELIHEARFAIGSGQAAALKGMDKGETPEQAVKGAAEYDQYTGPPVQVEYLIPRTKRKRG
jgi:20S proteasome alpha/beta subunit